MRAVFEVMRRPIWILGLIVAVTAVVVFIQLGNWQLRRLAEKRALGAEIVERSTATPVDLDVLVARGLDEEHDAYRAVAMTGTYESQEVWLLGKSLGGRSGNEVLRPFRTREGNIVLVDRGWIPLDTTAPAPPPGQVQVTGTLRKSQTFGPLGPITERPLRGVGRVDVPAIARGLELPVLPMWVSLTEQTPPQPGPFPEPVPTPTIGEGPHLSYAIQWYFFALVVTVGFPVLVWRTAGKLSAPETPSTPSSGV